MAIHKDKLTNIDDLYAEIDRLQSIVASYALTERELKTERDRLRALLLEIGAQQGSFALNPETRQKLVALANEQKP